MNEKTNFFNSKKILKRNIITLFLAILFTLYLIIYTDTLTSEAVTRSDNLLKFLIYFLPVTIFSFIMFCYKWISNYPVFIAENSQISFCGEFMEHTISMENLVNICTIEVDRPFGLSSIKKLEIEYINDFGNNKKFHIFDSVINGGCQQVIDCVNELKTIFDKTHK